MAFLTRHAALAAFLAIALGAGQRATANGLSEAQVKAALLFNFAMFVKWPNAADGRAVVVGVLDDGAFGRVVEGMRGQMPNGQGVSVRNVEDSDDLTSCDILFIGVPDDRIASATLARIGNAPVLTVGESSRFTKVGGIIRLYKDSGKFRFEINVTRAHQAKLQISSKMLNLARIVREH